MKNKKIIIKDITVTFISKEGSDYLSLTDMAKSKNAEFPADVVKNWLKTRFTIDFMGIWEQMHNPNFNMVEFDQFKNQAGVNSFVLRQILFWVELQVGLNLVIGMGILNG